MKVWIHELGHKGQEVRRLQKELNITADGKFGPQTEQAVKDYQSDNSLTTDGRVGPQTRGALGIEIYAGVDVSHHQGDIDWLTLKNSGLANFAWIKISEGKTYQDSKFRKNLDEARQLGIPVGGYHFGRPDNNDCPAEEVANFVKHVDLQPGDLRPVFDFERVRPGEPEFTYQWGLKFLEEAERQFGVRPILYTGAAFLKYKLRGKTEGLEDYILWHAYYRKSLKEGIKPSRLFGWPEWRVWQWTGNGQIPGIEGEIDRNWLCGGKKGFDEIIFK